MNDRVRDVNLLYNSGTEKLIAEIVKLKNEIITEKIWLVK